MDENDESATASDPSHWRYENLDGMTTSTVNHTSTITVDADLVAIGLATVFGLAVGLVVGRAAR
jgi:hypothetical protein